MTDKKRPQVGEWWRTRNGKIAFVAFDESQFSESEYPLRVYTEGDADWYELDGSVFDDRTNPYDLVEHLPYCTGFDWVELVESPDDWVTQDRVPARPGIDERAYESPVNNYLCWQDSKCMNWDRPVIHGAKVNGDILLLRCRRKDLPLVAANPTASEYDPKTFTSDWGPHDPVWPSRKDPPEQSCSHTVRIVDGRVTQIGISEQQCGWWVEVKQ